MIWSQTSCIQIKSRGEYRNTSRAVFHLLLDHFKSSAEHVSKRSKYVPKAVENEDNNDLEFICYEN